MQSLLEAVGLANMHGGRARAKKAGLPYDIIRYNCNSCNSKDPGFWAGSTFNKLGPFNNDTLAQWQVAVAVLE